MITGYYLPIDYLPIGELDKDTAIGSKVELCYSSPSDDIIEEMLHNNYGIIEGVVGDSFVVKLQHPIPEDVFSKYYSEYKPVKSNKL